MARHDIHSSEFWLKLAQASGYSAKVLCQNLAYSPRQWRRHTQALFGCSPQHFLDRLRLNLAPGLLRESTCIKSVSFLLGFKRLAHFSRAFHSHYGYSPSAFLKGAGHAVLDPETGASRGKFLDIFTAAFWGGAPGENHPARTSARGRPSHRIQLAPQARAELEKLARNRRAAPRLAHRARVLLAVSESQSSLRRLAAKLGLSRQAIWALCRRFKERGLEALRDAPRSGRPCRGGARPPRPK